MNSDLTTKLQAAARQQQAGYSKATQEYNAILDRSLNPDPYLPTGYANEGFAKQALGTEYNTQYAAIETQFNNTVTAITNGLTFPVSPSAQLAADNQIVDANLERELAQSILGMTYNRRQQQITLWESQQLANAQIAPTAG